MPYLPSLTNPFGARGSDVGVDRKNLTDALFRRTDVREQVAKHEQLRFQVGSTGISHADSMVGCRINIDGIIDISTAPKLRDLLVNTIDSGSRHIIVDIDGVEFLDASGLGILVGALQRTRTEGGSLRLVCTNKRLLKIFQIAGLEKAFGLPTSIPGVLLNRHKKHQASTG